MSSSSFLHCTIIYNTTFFLLHHFQVRKDCFNSALRNLIHENMQYLKKGQHYYIDAMFWMVDIGSYSNTNNPNKHFKAIFDIFQNLDKTMLIFQQRLGEA